MNLGECIKKERLKKGYNQPELAKIMNVSKQTVSNWENNNRVPDAYTLKTLADLFNVSVDYLLGKDNIKTNTLTELEKIVTTTNDKAEMLSALLIKKLIEEKIINIDEEITEETKEMIFNAIKLDAAIQNKKGATKK